MPFFKDCRGSLKKRLTTETGAEKSTKNFNGGGSCAHKNNIGMYGMQKP